MSFKLIVMTGWAVGSNFLLLSLPFLRAGKLRHRRLRVLEQISGVPGTKPQALLSSLGSGFLIQQRYFPMSALVCVSASKMTPIQEDPGSQPLLHLRKVPRVVEDIGVGGEVRWLDA